MNLLEYEIYLHIHICEYFYGRLGLFCEYFLALKPGWWRARILGPGSISQGGRLYGRHNVHPSY